MNAMKNIRGIIYLFLLLILPFSLTACNTYGSNTAFNAAEEGRSDAAVIHHQLVENLPFVVDGGAPKTIRTLYYSYANNRYLSMRDLASALDGTPKQFDLIISGRTINITTGKKYTPVGGENTPFHETAAEGFTYETSDIDKNPLFLDGRELKYHGFMAKNSAHKNDYFLNLTDVAMQMDLSLKLSDAHLALDTTKHYAMNQQDLDEEYFYYEIHSAIAGNASTGEIYTSWEPDLSVPIASTTKLMTYLVIKDLIAQGNISSKDMVTIPEKAAILSRFPDGTIKLNAGTKIPFDELMYGMLLPSSNECALSLAIHAAGSEKSFVKLMHQKAKDLGLSDKVRFFNSHGLPVYADSLTTTKVQNRMTANDMFLIVRHIMQTYPEITKITSNKSAYLKTMGITVRNTNPLLYNVPEVYGLKTGTTDMARNCLVVLMKTKDSHGKLHDLVVIQFGAEDETVRVSVSEELIRYAKQRLLAR